MRKFTVLLLAGGRGDRMWPLKTCKCLLPFAGKPIIRYIFDDLKVAGFDEFKIVTDRQSLNQLKASFKNEQSKIKFYIQKNIAGMAGAVLSVDDFGSNALVVVNPEDLLESKIYVDFLKKCQKTASDFVLTGIHQKKYFPGGYYLLEGEKITGLVEKPSEGNQPSNYLNLVLHCFLNPAVFIEQLKQTTSDKDDVYEMAVDRMIKKGIKTEIFKYDGYWQTLKYPWHILEMMKLIFSKRLREDISTNAHISNKTIIKGKVVIENGATIMEGACLVGPAYIGSGTIIGTNSLVRESNIGPNCVVGFSSEVARSWVGPNCWFHTNYIGDSVLQEDISFGSGAVTANYRLDQCEISVKKDNRKLPTGRIKFGAVIGSHVRVGVNASLMPGLLIGQDSFIGSGVVLAENLLENKFCSLDRRSLLIKDIHKKEELLTKDKLDATAVK